MIYLSAWALSAGGLLLAFAGLRQARVWLTRLGWLTLMAGVFVAMRGLCACAR